jgi:hypothetical protein
MALLVAESSMARGGETCIGGLNRGSSEKSIRSLTEKKPSLIRPVGSKAVGACQP